MIVLAVATDPAELPLHVSVLRGNRADNKTLEGLRGARLQRRFRHCGGDLCVRRRGRSSQVNLEAMDQCPFQICDAAFDGHPAKPLTALPQESQLGGGRKRFWTSPTRQPYVIAGGSGGNSELRQRAARLDKAEKN